MNSHPFLYDVIYSGRKTLAIQINAQGQVIVRAPRRTPKSTIDRFLTEKESWILKHLQKAEEKQSQPAPTLDAATRRHYIHVARDIFTQKAAYYAAIMNVTYGRITIKEQRTRWGSCSGKGNLNFNWRLIFAPEDVLDYVVVHELAHRREMNHSKAFYAIVEAVLPNYKQQRKWLRENGNRLWTNG